jgi:hypothetical protein
MSPKSPNKYQATLEQHFDVPVLYRSKFERASCSTEAQAFIRQFLIHSKASIHTFCVPEGHGRSLSISKSAAAYASWAAELARQQHPEQPVVVEVSCRIWEDRPGSRESHLSHIPLSIIHQLIPFLETYSPTLGSVIFNASTVGGGATLLSRMAVLRHLLHELTSRKFIIVIGNVEVFQPCTDEFYTMMTILQNTCGTETKEGGRMDLKVLVTHAGIPEEAFLASECFVDKYDQTGTLGNVY